MFRCKGFWLKGSGVEGVQASGEAFFGSECQVVGFMVQGSEFRVKIPGFRVQGSGFRVQGSGFRI